MLLLTVNSFDPDRWSDMLDRAVAVDSTGDEVILRCHADRNYIYCLDDPTWVAALVIIGVPVEIQDYPLDAIIETDWQVFEHDGKATVREMVDCIREDVGDIFYVSAMPLNYFLYCTNYTEIREIAQQRSLATVGYEQEQQEQE
jgi:hypothetical protein